MILDERTQAEFNAETHFASAARATVEELQQGAEACLGHPVAAFLMQALDGLVLILDSHRQVLATNDRVLKAVDQDKDSILGRRPGELFGCIHVPGSPGGCGTNHACAHCGAVQAVLAAQRTGLPVQAECLLTLRHGNSTDSAEFEIVASPLQVGSHQFIAVVLHDLSATKRRDALERLFYHDVANLMQGIRGWADLIASGTHTSISAAQKLVHLTDLLDRELKSHRAMARAEHGELEPCLREVLPMEILQDVADLLNRHASTKHRDIRLEPPPAEPIRTDPELLARVVLNMAVNAVEASCQEDTITLSAEREGGEVIFRVHNPGQIPEAARTRIFQRSFSTKGTAGRGLGTYAMKLFGETVLHGKVGFDTGADGTTFWIRISH